MHKALWLWLFLFDNDNDEDDDDEDDEDEVDNENDDYDSTLFHLDITIRWNQNRITIDKILNFLYSLLRYNNVWLFGWVIFELGGKQCSKCGIGIDK